MDSEKSEFIDIYDLSNFNIKNAPEHTIEIMKINSQIIVKRDGVEQINNKYLQLLEKDTGMKTIKIMSIVYNDFLNHYIDLLEFSVKKSPLYSCYTINKCYNINPYLYYIETKFQYNIIIYIYEYNPEYDIQFKIEYIREAPSLMCLLRDHSIINIIYCSSLCYNRTVYMIDVCYFEDDCSEIKEHYLCDIVNRNEKVNIYMKVFKINSKSVRIYIERIKLFDKQIYLCKFKGNTKFVKIYNIFDEFDEIIKNIKIIQLTNFPCGLQLDINNSEIITHYLCHRDET